jgi:hypothetical protein
MEADWAAEVGQDLPSIDIPWEGFLDLRRNRSAVHALEEAITHPAVGEALVTLNAPHSLVFTAKCDAWKLTRSEIDPVEFGARDEQAGDGHASYIDILQLDSARFGSFEFHESWARTLSGRLRNISLPNGRVDLVIRTASVNSSSGYGLTLYAAGCGAGASAAYASWEAVLRAAVTATINLDSTPSLTGE